jgi:hypothetical protein
MRLILWKPLKESIWEIIYCNQSQSFLHQLAGLSCHFPATTLDFPDLALALRHAVRWTLTCLDRPARSPAYVTVQQSYCTKILPVRQASLDECQCHNFRVVAIEVKQKCIKCVILCIMRYHIPMTRSGRPDKLLLVAVYRQKHELLEGETAKLRPGNIWELYLWIE